jgi:hypothetical protein
VAQARLAICAGIAAVLLFAADSAATPTLRLLKTHPVEVRATGFHSGEAVRIMVRTGQKVTRSSTSADSHGRFTASVKGTAAPACAALVVTATGADGSRAVFRRFPLCTTHGVQPPTSARS